MAGDPEGSEPRSMRKFYRFSVMNPVNMSSVCTAVRGGPFVELQLANTTQVRGRQHFRGHILFMLRVSMHYLYIVRGQGRGIRRKTLTAAGSDGLQSIAFSFP